MQVVDSEGYLKVKLVGGPAGPFVPYTGATDNVDLGEYEIKAGQVEFDQTPTGTAGVAVMRWNDQDGTVDLGLKGGNVTLQVGQEQVTRVVNKTGSNLLEANYQAVRVDGAQGNRLKVALAQADNDANSAETLGLVTETINDNQEGFVTTSGLVRSINTTGSLQGETWADGDMLYLSGTTAGQITNVKPNAPIHTVIMGYVVRAHATQGQIYVKVDNGYELEELHNVAITTPLNDQVLQYESATSLWKNKTISTGITIGSTAIASGVVGRVLFEGAGNVVQESSSLFWDNTNKQFVVSENQNASTGITISNTTSGTSATGTILFQSNGSHQSIIQKFSTLSSTYKILGANDFIFYNSFFGGDISILNDNPGGRIKLTAGAGSTSNLTIASTGNVLIGTTTDAGFKLDVNGTIRASFGQLWVGGGHYLEGVVASGTDASVRLRRTGDNGWVRYALGVNSSIQLAGNISTGEAQLFASNGGYFWTFYTNGSERMRIPTTGNLLINTTTDAGFRLDVNGTARVQNVLTVSSPGFTAFSTANTFAVDTGSNNYRTVSLMGWGGYHAGSGTNNTLDAFAVGGNTSSSSNASYFFRVNLSGGNSGGIYGSSGNNVSLAQLNAPTASNFYVTAQGGGGLVQGSTSGFLISTITDGQSLSLRSEKGNGSGGGGINYLSSINGSHHSHRFFHNNVEQMRLQYSGNLLINTTTDAGFRLDVNGTARVQGVATFGTTSPIGTESAIFSVNTSSNSFVRIYNPNTTIGSGVGIVFTNNLSGNASSQIWGDGIDTSGNTIIRFVTSNAFSSSEKLRITNNGNVLIGTTTNGASKLRVIGLPTSSAGLSAGDIWNDAGTLKIV